MPTVRRRDAERERFLAAFVRRCRAGASGRSVRTCCTSQGLITSKFRRRRDRLGLRWRMPRCNCACVAENAGPVFVPLAGNVAYRIITARDVLHFKR